MALGDFRHWLWIRVIAFVLGWLCLSAPATASAEAGDIAPQCHISTAPDEPIEAALARPDDWICDQRDYDHHKGRNLLIFPLEGKAQPGALVLRLGTFDALTIAPITPQGLGAQTHYTMADARPLEAGLQQAVELPAIPADATQLVVVIDGVWITSTVSNARLVPDGNAVVWHGAVILIIAAICGLLVGPMIFNLALWRVLRERFLIWHFCMVLGMLFQTLISTGLIVRLYPALTASQMVWMLQWSISGTMAIAFLFSATFIEQGKLSPRMIRALRWSAVWLVVVATIYVMRIPPLRTFAADFYFASYLPVFLILCMAMVQAIRRGSRAAWFQVAAWSPLMVLSLVRIFTNLGVGAKPEDTLVPFTLAVAAEVVITALGVADRFVSIRLDRDRAERRAGEMEQMADRDPLTGLLNRRNVEERFDALRADGYDTFALLDIDLFKTVNDASGHVTGDRVLVCVAQALAADEDVVALRMGGEEFLLALRGEDAVKRAEALRQAIPECVAREVAGLARPVTASMGLVVLPPQDQLTIPFKQMYEHADRLVYAAKDKGRNRMDRETILSPLMQGDTAAVAAKVQRA